MSDTEFIWKYFHPVGFAIAILVTWGVKEWGPDWPQWALIALNFALVIVLNVIRGALTAFWNVWRRQREEEYRQQRSPKTWYYDDKRNRR